MTPRPPLTRLELQVKLIDKFGNPLNSFERNSFESAEIRTLNYQADIIEAYNVIDGITTTNTLGAAPRFQQKVLTYFYLALKGITDSAYKSEIQGNVISYEPALMPESETTIAYTSWGIAFRFNQENELSENAAAFFIEKGFTLKVDHQGKNYFVYDIEKLLNS